MPKTDTPAPKAAKAAKAPARKAPARARPAKTTPAAPPDAPDAGPQPGPAAGREATVTFLGRTLRVVMPTAEQLDVWNRTAERLRAMHETVAAARTKEEKGAAAAAIDEGGLKLISRLSRIIHSVLAHEDDRDWIDEQFLARRLTYAEAAEVIPLALTALGVPNSRGGAKRPAARLRA